MKRIISLLILTLALTTAVTAVAQDSKADRQAARKERLEKFRQEKHDFYKQQLQLTDEQAAKFFPIFDEMESKKFAASREVHREARTLKKSENVTDEQYRAAADRAAALPQTMAAIDAEYYAKFCDILTPRQLVLYHRCDIDFRKQAVEKRSKEDDSKEK